MKLSREYKKKENYYSLNTKNENDEKCCLKFSQCDDNKFQIWCLGKADLKSFMSYAKKIEKLSWQEIYQLKGLNFEMITNISKPDYLDDSVQLYSMRVDQKFRIFGYRSRAFFYIVWFDNNHETC